VHRLYVAATDASALCSVADINGDVVTWAFPALDPVMERVIINHSGINDGSDTTSHPYRFSRFGGVWHYVTVTSGGGGDSKSKVVAAAIVTLANVYNPDKFQQINAILAKLYAANPSPLPLLSAYLAIFTKGTVGPSSGVPGVAATFNDTEWDNRRAAIAPVKSPQSHQYVQAYDHSS